MEPSDERPRCRACKKPLPRVRRRYLGTAVSKYGEHGDGLFCKLTCAYRWAVETIRTQEIMDRLLRGEKPWKP